MHVWEGSLLGRDPSSGARRMAGVEAGATAGEEASARVNARAGGRTSKKMMVMTARPTMQLIV